MAPSKTVRTISQEAFEGLVRENMEDLGMDPSEALEDAIQTLTLQGVDLSGIVTCVPGVTSIKDYPVIQSLDGLKGIAANLVSLSSQDNDKPSATKPSNQKVEELNTIVDLEQMIELLDKLYALCSIEGSSDASIATRNGGVELVTSICAALQARHERPLVSALKALSTFIHDLQSTETFRQSGGPKIVVDILNNYRENKDILDSGFSVVAAAATGNEILKEIFMDLKIDELLVQIMREQTKGNIHSLYDALRVLLTPDDNRVLASQVFGYARRFAKIGIAGIVVDALREGVNSPCLASASIALKAVAVNDEICKSIAECGGIDVVLQCIDDSGAQNNKAVASACCSLLSKLAGSDANKSAIVQKGGLDRLIKLSSIFSEDPSVLQEIMSIIWILSLRSPESAARAMEAGAGDFAIQAMQKFPAASQMQKQSCLMIRNLVVRNSENRTILLGNGIEKIIRKAKQNHDNCKDAAAAALRDLGLDDYNS
ncbi:uncharacterized protein LOC131235417 [Magnolia sinica]|uniref:uncharacterized protein LOC131235417 n=1 Tax=Magnolia sinica TaxID=86752 RepID=UPI002657E96E|nr:uncharacterized protein LOC131235417 [Magnolia sinica]